MFCIVTWMFKPFSLFSLHAGIQFIWLRNEHPRSDPPELLLINRISLEIEIVLSYIKCFFFIRIVGVESVQGPLSTSATSGQLCLPRVIVRMENLVQWRLAGETEVLGENLPQPHFVHHKYYMIRPGREARSPRWEARDSAWAARLSYIRSSKCWTFASASAFHIMTVPKLCCCSDSCTSWWFVWRLVFATIFGFTRIESRNHSVPIQTKMKFTWLL
jgi:hypothetical protein